MMLDDVGKLRIRPLICRWPWYHLQVRCFLKNAFESKTFEPAFFNQLRTSLESMSAASAKVAWAAWYLPTGLRPAASSACPFQNNRLTDFAVALYPTTGLSS